jgi:hypothetical protein
MGPWSRQVLVMTKSVTPMTSTVAGSWLFCVLGSGVCASTNAVLTKAWGVGSVSLADVTVGVVDAGVVILKRMLMPPSCACELGFRCEKKQCSVLGKGSVGSEK